MAKTLEISFDAALFRREASGKIGRQIPFAFSLALNETIEDTQFDLIDDLPSTFTIRNNWTEKGIRTRRSTKKRLIAVVGTRDNYMGTQALGGERAGETQAIPVGARPQPTSRTPKSKWPRALLARGGFIANLGGGPALWMPSRHKDRKKRKLRLMYRFRNTVRIPKRWPLFETLRKTASREWGGNVARALERALRTRRR